MASIKIPRTVGFGAGLIALFIAVYAIFGALWGLWRPTMTATAVEGGGFAIDTSSNAQFQGFGTFVVATMLLAGVLSFGVFKYAKSRWSLSTLITIGLLSVAGSLVFWLVGGFTAPTMPDIDAEVGSEISWAPTFSPLYGLAAAPFLALLVYWSGLYLVLDDSSESDAHSDRVPPVEVGQSVA